MLELRKRVIDLGPVLIGAVLLTMMLGTPYAAYAGKNKKADASAADEEGAGDRLLQYRLAQSARHRAHSLPGLLFCPAAEGP